MQRHRLHPQASENTNCNLTHLTLVGSKDIALVSNLGYCRRDPGSEQHLPGFVQEAFPRDPALSSMRSTHLPIIAQVRFLVGALGERTGWWTSKFTDTTSRGMLERLFPRTAPRAGLGSVVEAARRVHDDARLAPTSYHLFRLPVHLEDRLAGWLNDVDNTLDWPPHAEAELVAELGKVAGKVSTGAMGLGPVRLGGPKLLDTERTFREIASIYCAAAQQRVQVLPYFED